LLALTALGILQGFDLGAIPVDSADSLHLQIEAVKLGFADIYEYVSNADTMRVKNADLLDKEYLRTRSRLIDMKKAQTPQYRVPASGGTVYLTAADATGMMVSYIQSNYQGLGSGIVVDGISMQNRGYSFVLRPGHANVVAPRRRPFHTIIPAFVTQSTGRDRTGSAPPSFPARYLNTASRWPFSTIHQCARHATSSSPAKRRGSRSPTTCRNMRNTRRAKNSADYMMPSDEGG